MMYITKHNPVASALIATAIMVPLVFGMFLTLEPTAAIGQNPQDFTVRQQINEEIAFTLNTQNVTMDTQLQGLTGGTSNGSTTFEVTTNNPDGYSVTIQFASTTAMEFETGPEYIPNLGATAVPNFTPSSATGTSAFGYTVVGPGPGVVAALLGDTSSCGSGSASSNACFKLGTNAQDTFTIIDHNGPSDAGGDEYTLWFRVVADTNPNPALPEGFYTATATLTAINTP